MAYPVSLSTLTTRAQQRSNLEGATGFITVAEWTDMLNQSINDWYDLVRLTTWGGQFYRAQYSLPGGTLPNVGAYLLPPDFLSSISVDCFVTPNMVLSARPFQEENRNMFRWYPVGWLFDKPIFYQLQGPNLVFIPVPQSVFTVQINYVPVAPQLSAPLTVTAMTGLGVSPIVVTVASTAGLVQGQSVAVAGAVGNTAANGTWSLGTVTPTTAQLLGTTGNGAFAAGGCTLTPLLDSINGWDEWIVLDSAIKALTKDGQLDVIPQLEARQEAQAERIRKGAVSRDQGAAEVVHDVTSSFDDWGG